MHLRRCRERTKSFLFSRKLSGFQFTQRKSFFAFTAFVSPGTTLLRAVPLSLSLSLSLTFYLSSLSLFLSIFLVLQSHSACIMYTHIPVVLRSPLALLFSPCLVQPSSRSYKKKAHFVPTLSVQQIWFSLTRIVYLLAKYFASFDHHPCLVVTLSSSLMFFDDTLSSMAFFSSWLFLAARSR